MIIYRTFEDYEQDKGELKTGDLVYDGTYSFRKQYITLKNKTPGIPKGQRKIKIYGKDMWGFELNNILFRIIEKSVILYA